MSRATAGKLAGDHTTGRRQLARLFVRRLAIVIHRNAESPPRRHADPLAVLESDTLAKNVSAVVGQNGLLSIRGLFPATGRAILHSLTSEARGNQSRVSGGQPSAGPFSICQASAGLRCFTGSKFLLGVLLRTGIARAGIMPRGNSLSNSSESTSGVRVDFHREIWSSGAGRL